MKALSINDYQAKKRKISKRRRRTQMQRMLNSRMSKTRILKLKMMGQVRRRWMSWERRCLVLRRKRGLRNRFWGGCRIFVIEDVGMRVPPWWVKDREAAQAPLLLDSFSLSHLHLHLLSILSFSYPSSYYLSASFGTVEPLSRLLPEGATVVHDVSMRSGIYPSSKECVRCINP